MLGKGAANQWAWEEYLSTLFSDRKNISLQESWSCNYHYRFTPLQIEQIKFTSLEQYKRCLNAVKYILKNNLLETLGIPPDGHQSIIDSWNRRQSNFCAKIEFALSDGQIRFNRCLCRNYSGLLESAVVQWHWLQDRPPHHDQFNNIWQALVEAFERRRSASGISSLILAHDLSDDQLKSAYVLLDAASESGLLTTELETSELAWDPINNRFSCPSSSRVESIFLLGELSPIIKESSYPSAALKFLADIAIPEFWTVLYEHSGFYEILAELNPESSNPCSRFNLIPAKMRTEPVSLMETSLPSTWSTSSLQRASAGDRSLTIGSWIVDGEVSGIGIEESSGNRKLFVPHLI